MKGTGSRPDNQPEAERTSVWPERRAVPGAAFRRKGFDGRADNQPEAARTIEWNDGRSSVPRDFNRPAMKTSGRRANNQPEAARTSVRKAVRKPVPRESARPVKTVKRIPNPGAGAKAEQATGWTASNAGVGWVNNIAAVGCGWKLVRKCRVRRHRPQRSRFRGPCRSSIRSRSRNECPGRRGPRPSPPRCRPSRSGPSARAACLGR